MSLEWKTVELKSIANVNMGQSPKSEYYNENSEGYPFLQGNKTFGDKYPTFELFTTDAKKIAKKDSVIMSVRAPVGDLNMSPKDLCIGRGICSLEMKKGSNEFLYYLLKANIHQLINRQSGTVFGSINKNDIETMELFIPVSTKEQNKITAILKSIDDKIDVLKKVNKNLDNLIKILFKNFFEDFKPFENQEFKDSEIGKIPVDWDLVDLGSIIKIYNGYSYKGNELQESNCAMATIKNFNRDGSFRADGFKEILYSDKIKDHHFLNDNDVLISCTDVTQDADIIGNCILLQNKQGYGEVIMSMDLVKIESQIPEINNFLLASILRSYRFKYHILGYVNGTTVLHLDKKGISKFKLALPNDLTILEEFGNTIGLIYNQIGNNLKEIDNLSKVRDTLLPKLMSGEINVSKINCDLKILIKLFIISFSNYLMEVNYMKTKIISKIQNQMKPFLNQGQYLKLTNSLLNSLKDIEIIDNNNDENEIDNLKLLTSFLSAKQVEGRSEKTIEYYQSTLEKMLTKINKQVYNITTDEIRKYLYDYKNEKNSSKITIDNMRRIFSSFFSWLEDEDYILKNPVKRIHRVKTGRVVKEVLTDENLEVLRDNCEEIRDLAIVEILISTGIRVGELVRLNIEDINFYERECVVFGKGESERVVYFDARTKIHLMEYIESRTDENPALFVSLNKPNERLGISGVETRLRELGNKCNISKVHPHKFRRTLATNAIDKGMPIEQVQKLLGHVQIDTTMQYAMVNQSNVKIAHRKFIS